MKNMKLTLCLLLALLLALACAHAEPADLYAAPGEKLVILDQDGLKITLSGDYQASGNVNGNKDNYMSHMACVLENNTGETIRVTYTAIINGWNMDSNHSMDGASKLPTGTKAKSDIWFTTEDCEVTCYEDLETMILSFRVRSEDNKDLFEATTATIRFNAEAPAEEAPAEEAAAESVDVEAVDAALQGKWVYPANGGSFTFAGGSVTMDADGSQLGGTYTINPDAQSVDIVLKASDADVNASLPFTFEGGALALSNNKGEALEKAAEEEAPVEEPAGEAEPEYATLDVGSKGEEVKNLQKYLIALGYLDGGADGVYGKGTAGGVKKFQAAEGLEQTGTADSETQARLFAKKLPEKPVIVAKPWKLIINSAGTPELYIRFRNDGDVTVDRVDFYVYCYDSYGDSIKGYKRYDYDDDWFDEKIRPGETSSSEWYWGLYGYDGTSRIRMAVHKYHTVDGNTVDIPYGDLQWVEFSR